MKLTSILFDPTFFLSWVIGKKIIHIGSATFWTSLIYSVLKITAITKMNTGNNLESKCTEIFSLFLVIDC